MNTGKIGLVWAEKIRGITEQPKTHGEIINEILLYANECEEQLWQAWHEEKMKGEAEEDAARAEAEYQAECEARAEAEYDEEQNRGQE